MNNKQITLSSIFVTLLCMSIISVLVLFFLHQISSGELYEHPAINTSRQIIFSALFALCTIPAWTKMPRTHAREFIVAGLFATSIGIFLLLLATHPHDYIVHEGGILHPLVDIAGILINSGLALFSVGYYMFLKHTLV